MSETNNYPNFYQPAEGRPTPKEEQLLETAQTFNGLFDDLILQHMEAVKQFESIKGKPTANLLKHIEVDGQSYTLALRDNASHDEGMPVAEVTFRPSEIIKRDISLQRIEGGYGREHWSYRLGADGAVRRWDGGDATAKRQKERELGIEGAEMLSGGETLEEIGRVALKNMQNLTENSIPNGRLEEDMGLNNQPVALEELVGLSDFLKQANYSD